MSASGRARLEELSDKEEDELQEHLRRRVGVRVLRGHDEGVEVALADLGAGALAEAVGRGLQEAGGGELGAPGELLRRDDWAGALEGRERRGQESMHASLR